MLRELMENFYFTEREAKVYLAALEAGRSRVSFIAKKAELNRITTYEILKRLAGRGAVHSATYGGILSFIAVEPELLVQKMSSRLTVAERLIPELSLLNRSKNSKPAISFYEGTEGLRTLYEDTLTSKEKIIYNIANPFNLSKNIGTDFLNQYITKRVRRKILVKVLLPYTPHTKHYRQEVKKNWREVRFFDPVRYDIPNEILIYDTKVVLLSFSSLIGVQVTDGEISRSMQMLWQMLWDTANYKNFMTFTRANTK